MADKEKLSALIDGEEIDLVLIDTVKQNADDQETWKSFALTRDILRGETVNSASWDIAAKVAMQLENEVEHERHSLDTNVSSFSTTNRTSDVVNTENASSTVASFLENQPKKPRLPNWLQQLTQVGIAAAVSLVVIVGVQQYNGGEQTASDVVTQLPVLQTIPLSGSVTPVSLTRDNGDQNVDEVQLLEQRRRINSLYQDYELQLRLNAAEINEIEPAASPLQPSQE